MKGIVLAVIALCMCSDPCPPQSEVCLHSFYQCACPETGKGPSVGCHSHSTHYNITYTQADLDYNQTRTDIRNMLHSWRTENEG